MKQSITRKGRFSVTGGAQHNTLEESFEDAANLALAAPGKAVTITPPSYEVVVSDTVTATPPAPVQPPVVVADPPPTSPPQMDERTVHVWARLSAYASPMEPHAEFDILPGQRIPLDPSDASMGSVVYHEDGRSLCIENCYTTTARDLTGAFRLTTAAGTIMFDAELTIWARTRTHPIWINAPQVNPSADLSMFPLLGAGGESVDLTAIYSKADNSPMGRSLWCAAMATTGERQDLGPIDGYSAIYLKNPTAANAAVVRGLADAACAFPFHAIDPATNRMVSLAGNPKITYLQALAAQYGNTVPKITTACPQNLNEADAHAPTFCALAAAVYGTDYDREELAMWANYVGGLWQNWTYRLPSGMRSCTTGQTRGKGRALTSVLYAAKLSDQPDYFSEWVKSAGAEMSTVFPAQTGIHIDQRDPAYYNGKGFSNYQEHILIGAIGQALDLGYTEFQPALDYFAEYLTSALLDAPHELATLYSMYHKDDAGTIAADWLQALQFTAAKEPKVAAALQCAEGSQALQDAMGATGTKPGDFLSYPAEPTGYAAMMQPALVAVARHATNQDRAQAAWEKFQQWLRADFSQNPKYNILPRAA